MAGHKQEFHDEGIEIHWDEREGYLSLACGREAFDRFRQLVRDELRDLPEIPVDEAITVEISDTRKIVARRESPRNYLLSAVFIAVFIAIALPWGAGVAAIARWLTR